MTPGRSNSLALNYSKLISTGVASIKIRIQSFVTGRVVINVIIENRIVHIGSAK